MNITITINTDNDAFYMQETIEVARILRDLARRIEGNEHFSAGHWQPISDYNGNEVGQVVCR